MPGAVSMIRVIIAGEAKGVTESLAKTEEGLKHVGKSADGFGRKFAKFGKTVALGVAGAALAVGAFSVKAGSELDDAEVMLHNALKDTGQSAGAFGKALDPLLKKMEKWGYTNREVDDSLATLVRAHIPAKQAVKDAALAANIARARNIDLATATGLVTKAALGLIGPLKRQGIDLGIAAGGALAVKKAHDAITKAYKAYLLVQSKVHDGTLKGKAAYLKLRDASTKVTEAQHAYNEVSQTGAKAIDALSKRFKGSAATAADTFKGKQEALKAQLTDMSAKLGQKLIPKLEKLAVVLMNGAVWLTKHKTVAFILAGIIGGVLLAATVAWTVSLFLAGGALAFLISPITLVVAAVAALAFGIYELVKHWSAVWGAITSAVSTAWHAITGAVSNGWNTVLSFVKSLPGRAVEALGAFAGLLQTWALSAMQKLAAYGPTAIGIVIGFFLGLPFRFIGAMIRFDTLLVQWALKAFTWLFHNFPTIVADLFRFFVLLPIYLIAKLTGFEAKLGVFFLGQLKTFATKLPGYAANVFAWFKGLPSAIIHAVGDIAKAIAPLGKNLVMGIVHGIEASADAIGHAVKSAINSIPGGSVITGTLHKLHIPGFALGGIVSSRTLAMVGERGPEAIIPLTNPRRASAVMAQAGLVGGGGDTTHITYQTSIVATNPREALTQATREWSWHARTSGR